MERVAVAVRAAVFLDSETVRERVLEDEVSAVCERDGGTEIEVMMKESEIASDAVGLIVVLPTERDGDADADRCELTEEDSD